MGAEAPAGQQAQVNFELVVLDGPQRGSAIAVPQGRIMLGSAETCHIRLQHPSVLLEHAELALAQDGNLWIRDLTDGKFTTVDGTLIKGTAQLHDGSFVQLGTIELCLRAKGAGGSGTHVPVRGGGDMPSPRSSPTNVGRPSRMGPAHPVGNQDALQPGDVVNGRYRIVEKLAEGGMGEVYKVEHVELDKMFAMKVMKSHLGRDKDFADRFKREAVAASKIGHPNIVDVSDFGRTEAGDFYFVMEFLHGQTLGALVRDHGAIPASRVLNIMVQLVRALSAAHKAGIVHRDLKPENVMLLQRPGQEDFVKVVDFGVAKLARSGDSKGTAIGMVVGTPQYMAPEQASGLPIDPRTDVYSTGLIFYELLKGKPPFEEATPSLLMAAHIYKQPAALTFASGDPVSDSIQTLVMKMLAKERENRPQTMEEVLAALNQCIAERHLSIAKFATPAISQSVKALMGQPGGTMQDSQLGPLPTLPPMPQQQAQGLSPSGSVPIPVTQTQTQAAPAPSTQMAAVQKSKAPMFALFGLLVLLGGAGGVAFAWWPKPEPVVVVAPPPPPPKPEPAPLKVEPPPEVPKAKAVKIVLTTTPPGAQVLKGGALMGMTPFEFEWERGLELDVELALKGYTPEKAKVLPIADLKLDFPLKKLGGGPVAKPGGKTGKKPNGELLNDPYGGQVEDLQSDPY